MQGIKSSPSYVDPEQLVQVIAHQFDGEGPLQLGHPAGRDSSNDFFQNCHALRSEEARLMPEKSPDAKRLAPDQLQRTYCMSIFRFPENTAASFLGILSEL